MASIDNDSEIQFNLHHEEDEEGQGDVHLHQPVPMEKPDDLPDDAPQDDSPALSPIPVQEHELPMLADSRRNYSYDRQDHADLNHGPVRRRDLPQRRRYDVEDNARQRHPGRDPVLPQHYPDQAARPVANHSRVHVRPEFFDGEGDWDQYISHFQNCADLGRWSETDKALTLSACLMGQARAFYLGLSPLDRSSYQRLVQKFSERFGSVRQQSRYLTKFETRKRRPEEPIASLGDDLRLLTQRAYPDLGPDAQESLALHQFYKAITLEMKCRCIDRDCRTVEDAVQVVERYESILGEGNEKKKSSIRAINNPADSNPSQSIHYPPLNNKSQSNNKSYPSNTTEIVLKQVLERLEKLEDGNSSKVQRNSNNNNPKPYYRRGTCFVCQSPDHFLRDFPIYKKCQSEMQSSNEAVSENENPSTL